MDSDPIELGDVGKQEETHCEAASHNETNNSKKTPIYFSMFIPEEKDDKDNTTEAARFETMKLIDLGDSKTSDKLVGKCGWIHIPANDIDRAQACIKILAGTKNAELVRESWERKLRPRIPDLQTPLPTHAWSMSPSVEWVADTSVDETQIMEIFTTYLNWESHKVLTSKLTNDCTRFRHQRRTLDQSYYSGLESTTSRDAGQTVSKWTGKHIPENGHREAVESSLLIMVNQLWIWNLGHGRLVTRCPFYDPELMEDTQISSAVDVMSSFILQLGDRSERGAFDHVAELLSHAATTIFRVTQDGFGDPLAIYRWAIANKTARHTALLETFWERRKNRIPEGLSGEGAEELELALELTDILDELNIMKRFLNQQYTTFREIYETWLGRWSDSPHIEIESRKAEVEGLITDAERTHKMVIELLDLEQKAASLGEAQTTSQQGRAVMLFTIITIIFLPLSFFVSYFGQNVSELTGDPQNPTSGQVWKIAAPISVVVILCSLAVAFFIMYPNSAKSCLRRKKTNKTVV